MGSGGGGGGPTTNTTTSVTERPEYVTPYANQFLSRASSLSNQPFNAYTGQRVAGLTPQHEQGIAFGQGALGGAIPQGLQTLQNTASGGMVGQNPYLDSMFNRAADQISARTANTTRLQGLTNAGAAQQQTRDMNDLATQLYGGQYQQDVGNMLNAAQALPGYASSGSQLGLGLGDVNRDYQQALLNESIRAFTERQMYPYTQLDVLGNAIGMSMGGGGTTTTTSPGFYQPSSTAGMLGAGLAGIGGLQQLFGRS